MWFVYTGLSRLLYGSDVIIWSPECHWSNPEWADPTGTKLKHQLYFLCTVRHVNFTPNYVLVDHTHYVYYNLKATMMTSWNGKFSTLLALCAGNSSVTGEFLAQRPMTRSFDVFFDLPLNKRLSKRWWGWSFETPSRSLWRHRNALLSCGPWQCSCNVDVMGPGIRVITIHNWHPKGKWHLIVMT